MPKSLQVSENSGPLLKGAGLVCLADVFAWNAGERLDKAGLEQWRQRWRMRLAGPDGSRRTVYLKRFEHPPLRRQWERWRSGTGHLSTAGVEWRNARDLARAGIRAAEAIAFGEQMRGPLEVRSCILLGEVPGVSLEKWVPANVVPMAAEPDLAGRRKLLDGLARFVARFHAAGFVHRDLYLCHIFFDAECEASTGEGHDAENRFCLIDLQRVFRPKWRKQRWVIKDLAALDFSTPADRVSRWERLRFLCRYVRIARFGPARELARKIEAKRAVMTRRVESRRRRSEQGQMA